MIKFFAPGPPVAQARPRVARNGGVYEPPRCTEYKHLIATFAEIQMSKAGLAPTDKAVKCTLLFQIPVPKSWPKIRKENAHNETPGRPDLDNYIKAVLDALNGIAYKDDGQVRTIVATKQYAEEEIAGTLVYVEEMEMGK